MKKCGAKTRAGGKCQLQAGHGTDHIGTGRCRLHGGASKGAPKGNKNALKHGIYSKLFTDSEVDEAKQMQGSIENELAIARLQLLNLLKIMRKYGDNPILDKVEEKTIVQDEGEQKKNKEKKDFLKALVKSAKHAGEEYDPDGDEDYIFMDDPDQSGESEVFERKRTFQRRDLTGEFIRLTTLIANLERQLLQSSKIKVEIEMIRKGEKQVDDVEQLTDIELDAELQKLIGGLSV
ncbi:HGGxSTG domain-containing protein [Acinetobacter sp. NS4_7]